MTDLREQLHLAAKSGDIEACGALLDAGVDVNHSVNNGYSTLMVAAGEGHEELCRFLVARGAKVRDMHHTEASAFSIAAGAGHLNCCVALHELGASIDHPDTFGWTPLFRAVQKKHRNVVRFLMDKGVQLNLVDNNKWSPLFWAAEKRDRPMFDLLEQGGARRDWINYDGLTAFQHAIKSGNKGVAEFMLDELGEDLAQRTYSGRTLMQLAGNKAEMKELLLAARSEREVDGALDGVATNDGAAKRASMSPL